MSPSQNGGFRGTEERNYQYSRSQLKSPRGETESADAGCLKKAKRKEALTGSQCCTSRIIAPVGRFGTSDLFREDRAGPANVGEGYLKRRATEGALREAKRLLRHVNRGKRTRPLGRRSREREEGKASRWGGVSASGKRGWEVTVPAQKRFQKGKVLSSGSKGTLETFRRRGTKRAEQCEVKKTVGSTAASETVVEKNLPCRSPSRKRRVTRIVQQSRKDAPTKKGLQGPRPDVSARQPLEKKRRA